MLRKPAFNYARNLAALLLIVVSLNGCGVTPAPGAPTPLLAAQNYVAALGDRDFDRAKALRLPVQFRTIAFNTSYFNDERNDLGLANLPNPTFNRVEVRDSSGKQLPTNSDPASSPILVTLSVSSGPTLVLTSELDTNLWYVSGIDKLK